MHFFPRSFIADSVYRPFCVELFPAEPNEAERSTYAPFDEEEIDIRDDSYWDTKVPPYLLDVTDYKALDNVARRSRVVVQVVEGQPGELLDGRSPRAHLELRNVWGQPITTLGNLGSKGFCDNYRQLTGISHSTVDTLASKRGHQVHRVINDGEASFVFPRYAYRQLVQDARLDRRGIYGVNYCVIFGRPLAVLTVQSLPNGGRVIEVVIFGPVYGARMSEACSDAAVAQLLTAKR